ncbi:MAG: hypothetical protein SOW46_10990 [Candidatus Aphodomonas sp.]|nr:hypothetical protein [Candidatus Aphodomonas sp.]
MTQTGNGLKPDVFRKREPDAGSFLFASAKNASRIMKTMEEQIIFQEDRGYGIIKHDFLCVSEHLRGSGLRQGGETGD